MTAGVPPPGGQGVAVIGGGFSGLLTALHVLAVTPPVTVHLVERAPRVGRGRAYATERPDHLLNVRAANMSAFPDRPDHFRQWLVGRGEGGFVSRKIYGDYLEALLAAALRAPGCAERLRIEADEARAVRRVAGGLRVELARGGSFEAEAVVLATGLSPPRAPKAVSPEARRAPRFVVDPWATDLRNLPDGEILLLGTGLTMVDVALALARAGRRLTALSRRGLTARRHVAAGAMAPPPPGLPATPAEALRIVRSYARSVGWREAVDSLRPLTPAIWRSWSRAEKRRALRHLQPWWDVHRHRMAPAIAVRLAALVVGGALTIAAGELKALRPAPEGGFEADIRPRRQLGAVVRRFAAVVNCTGLSGDLAGDPSGLIADLLAHGLAAADPLGLGLDVDAALRVRGADGRPTPGLYAVGPLTRAAVWESIAVPDLRHHAAALATQIADDLGCARAQRAGSPSS